MTAGYPLPVLLAVALVALLAAWLLTPLVRRLALALGVVDRPDHRLKTHARPMPYLGGLVILLGVAAGWAVFIGCGAPLPVHDRARSVVIGLGTLLMALLGLWDDRRNLSPWTKLVWQSLIAGFVAAFGLRMQLVMLPDWLNFILTVVWLVGMTNAFNLIDIMDGLASGVAVIAGLLLYLLAVTTPLYDKTFVAVWSLALAGAAAGFLRHNCRPAKIYLGDMGALAIGFLLATLAIGESYTSSTVLGLLAPLLVLAIPLYDTFYVIVLRLLARKSILRGSRDHCALRLRRLGLSVEQTVLTLYAIALLFGLGGLALALSAGVPALLLAGGLVLLALLGGALLARVTME